ncbi:uncharacterized protein LOC144133746 [Amblyomma americanum]
MTRAKRRHEPEEEDLLALAVPQNCVSTAQDAADAMTEKPPPKKRGASVSQGRLDQAPVRHRSPCEAIDAPAAATPSVHALVPASTVVAGTPVSTQRLRGSRRLSSTSSAGCDGAQTHKERCIVEAAYKLEVTARQSRRKVCGHGVPPSPEETPAMLQTTATAMTDARPSAASQSLRMYSAAPAGTAPVKMATMPVQRAADAATHAAPRTAGPPLTPGSSSEAGHANGACAATANWDNPPAALASPDEFWTGTEGTSDPVEQGPRVTAHSKPSLNSRRAASFPCLAKRPRRRLVAHRGSRRPACTSPWWRRLFALAALLVAAALVSTAVWLRRPIVAQSPRFCSTKDCDEHAAALGVGNYEAQADGPDPCRDFGLFVCSAAAPYRRYPGTARPVLSTQLLLDYASRLGRETPSAPVLAKPNRAMRTCLDASSRGEDDVERLLRFMEGRSFDWPTDEGRLPDPSDYSTPLKVLSGPLRVQKLVTVADEICEEHTCLMNTGTIEDYVGSNEHAAILSQCSGHRHVLPFETAQVVASGDGPPLVIDP